MDNPYPICENCIFIDEPLDKDPCQECNRAFIAQRIKPNFVSKRKPQTNADRIRAMTDEELAEWICEVQDGESLQRANYLPSLSKGFWLKWLRKEAKG